jgi:diketogulonate reductase-like aldo/keto reductase
MPIHLMSTRAAHVPKLLYGTAWKKEKTASLVERALTLGFRGVDTACQPKHYDEAGVGSGVAAACRASGLGRQHLYLQTKFTPVAGQSPDRIPYDPGASPSEQVRQSCEASLTNLHTTYLDCLLLHSPISPFENMMQHWRAMERLVEAGAIKALGISNCYELTTLKALWQATTIKPLVVQNRFYAKTGFDADIRAFCSEHEAVYQSFWTITANARLLAHPTLLGLASANRVTPPQLLFRFLTQVGVVVLTGPTSEQHMREDLAIFDFTLSARELRELTALLV